MERVHLEKLPKKTLIELAKMYSRNWQSLDGNWFGLVEAEFGLETAVRLDLRSWEKQAVLEAQRIKKVLKLDKGGLSSVLTVLSFMTWQLASPLFEIEEEGPGRIVFYYPRCVIHESRNRQHKPVFPCKTMKLGLLTSIARVVEPRAVVRCLNCPPDPHHEGVWCKWELYLR
ncbi:MAG: DUF6125 family protein [Chloroflexi bacterium]|nr:DUF6125 family protein [Chloroflexota bacterium]